MSVILSTEHVHFHYRTGWCYYKVHNLSREAGDVLLTAQDFYFICRQNVLRSGFNKTNICMEDLTESLKHFSSSASLRCTLWLWDAHSSWVCLLMFCWKVLYCVESGSLSVWSKPSECKTKLVLYCLFETGYPLYICNRVKTKIYNYVTSGMSICSYWKPGKGYTLFDRLIWGTSQIIHTQNTFRFMLANTLLALFYTAH